MFVQLVIAYFLFWPKSANVTSDDSINVCQTSTALGLMTGDIGDWQVSASSHLDTDARCHQRYGRVYQPSLYAWCAKYKSASEWLQVDLGMLTKLTGLMTQGRAGSEEWITTYMISYSAAGTKWKYVTDQYGNQKVFSGNSDSFQVKHTYFEYIIVARFVKLHVVHWNRHPSVRLELIGCQACTSQLAAPPYAHFTASSEHKRCVYCQATYAYMTSNAGWRPQVSDVNQWLQVDVGHPTRITGLITSGRYDNKRQHWVTRYRLSYSNDSRIWLFYKEDSSFHPKEFGGNIDNMAKRKQFLATPFTARFVRFHPLSWHEHIGLRADVVGCAHTDNCERGYVKINPHTPCIANVAFNKNKWLNGKRSYGSNEYSMSHGRKSNERLAASAPWCAILDNFYLEKPVYVIDLAQSFSVSGVIVETSRSAGKASYKEYMYNLDKMLVYVHESEKFSEDSRLLCGFLSHLNGAIYQHQLHIQCLRVLRGRYVVINVIGTTDRSSRLFSVTLCDVIVY